MLVSVVVIGGLGSTSGPVLGALWVIGLPTFFPGNSIVPLLASGVGLLLLLLYFPGGLVQIGYSARDALLSWAEQRLGPAPAKTVTALPKALARPARAPLPEDGPVLKTAEIRVRFGGVTAVDGVSIEVGAHEIVGLIGTNGAGKSTLMNAIGGFVPATGTVELLGRDVTGMVPARRAALGFGRTFQAATLFPELTVAETVQIALEARGRTDLLSAALWLPKSVKGERAKKSEAGELIDFLGLGRYANAFIGDLSTGTRRIVELAGLLALEAMAGADALLSADLPIAEKRELIHLGMAQGSRFAEPTPNDVVCRDLEVPVGHPQPGVIRVRTYTPPGDAPAGGRPAHMFLHGGAWWLGTVEHFDSGCGNLATLADCVVVSVDYRLAPEYPYPVPLEDGIAAWVWLGEHATALGVDPTRMSIGGGSAGGNLAAAACLAPRDRGLSMPVAQALTVPATDLSLDYPSVAEYGVGYGPDASLVRQAVAFYLGGHGDPADPYVSPIRAQSLAGLPPALVMTCEYDLGRDAAEAYARRLHEAGIPTTLRRWDGFVHNAHVYTALLPEARDFRAALAAFLREHHQATA